MATSTTHGDLEQFNDTAFAQKISCVREDHKIQYCILKVATSLLLSRISNTLAINGCVLLRFAFLWDFSTVLLPSILALTVLADYLTQFFIVWLILFTALLIPLLSSILKHSGQTRRTFFQFLSQPYSSSLACIREPRVWTNIFTVIAILAVDFHIFPRRLAKVETYGTGLMDVGIGCFIVCHGMVSKEARYPDKHAAFPTVTGYVRSVWSTAWKTWPFLLVGLLRLLSVKAADYQEHITEYGVHWNFFFTIAVVRVG